MPPAKEAPYLIKFLLDLFSSYSFIFSIFASILFVIIAVLYSSVKKPLVQVQRIQSLLISYMLISFDVSCSYMARHTYASTSLTI